QPPAARSHCRDLLAGPCAAPQRLDLGGRTAALDGEVLSKRRGLAWARPPTNVAVRHEPPSQTREEAPLSAPARLPENLPPAALVTGAAKRVGRTLALALAADGWAVAVHYRASAAEAEALV